MSALVHAASDGRHVAKDHPVLRRARFNAALVQRLAALDDATALIGEAAATEINNQTTRIDLIAQAVVLLPDVPLTGQQRRSMLIIAEELMRRAQS